MMSHLSFRKKNSPSAIPEKIFFFNTVIIRNLTDKTVFLTGMEKRAQLKDYRIRSGVVKVSVLLKSKRAILANSFSDLHKRKFWL